MEIECCCCEQPISNQKIILTAISLGAQNNNILFPSQNSASAHHEGLSVEGHKCGGVNRKRRGSHRRKEKYSTGPSEATTREGNKRSRVSQPLPHRSLALLLNFARKNVCKTYLSRTQAEPAKSRLELTVYTMSGFAAAQPEMEQKNEGCQHM